MLRFLLLSLLAVFAQPALAATSQPVSTQTVTARLVSVADGVGTGVASLQFGLDLELAEGWKTYWRSPGEVGLPPDITWDGSANVSDVTLSYPAPTRFTAFEIENFGYADRVVFPLTVTVDEPGQAMRLDLTANLLVCAELCIPETVNLTLDLPAAGGMDTASAALLSEWVAKVPGDAASSGMSVTRIHQAEDALTLTVASQTPFQSPDVFPEDGAYAAYGKPEIRLGDGGRVLWASLPVLSPGDGQPTITVTDGARAATLTADLSATPPAPPTTGQSFLLILGFAVLGGLILNVMPCVLPVLSIKLASALKARDRGPARIRAGFLANVAGIFAFFLALAGVMIALRAAGVAVGWGVQFQNPVFLMVMVVLMTLFAANLLGFFEISLGHKAMTGMARAEARSGWTGDFATGAFAAIMSTPCSAPFLGTAVTYALTSGPEKTLMVFAALALGLSIPYLVMAARPALIQRLPRPGIWMNWLRTGLGLLMVLAVLWLITVLAGAAGTVQAAVAGGLALALLLALSLRRHAMPIALGGLLAGVALAAIIPTAPATTSPVLSGHWQTFDEARIQDAVAEGHVVFVDVTADWCLTCKVNKRLVLDDDPVLSVLGGPDVLALQADWTRPNPDIASYLQANGRFGIPFNAVYGPGAPGGIPLPELLTADAVMDALNRAGSPDS